MPSIKTSFRSPKPSSVINGSNTWSSKTVLRTSSSLPSNHHQFILLKYYHENDKINHREWVLCRPWRPVRRKKREKNVFLLLRLNYEFYVNLNESCWAIVRIMYIIEIRAFSSFNQIDLYPKQLRRKVRPLTYNLKVCDARGKRLQIAETIHSAVTHNKKYDS